jgi:hypothetical protein
MRNKPHRERRVQKRTCARAGCDGPSAFTLVFDYSKAEAWLCDLWGEPGQGAYDLCVGHAERFTAPLGWSYLDRRQTAPALFVERTDAADVFEQSQETGPQQATA